MLNYVAKAFRKCFEAILWLNLVGFIIAGGYLANNYFYDRSGVEKAIVVIIGLIAGGFIGLVIDIISGGLVANLLNMVDNIERIAFKENIEKEERKEIENAENDLVIEKQNIWVCNECGNKNEMYLIKCKKCGKEFQGNME